MGGKKRLSKIEETSESESELIKKAYKEAFSYQHTDPKVSLWKARETAEAICKQIFMREISPTPSKKLMLGRAIEKFRERGVLPAHILPPLETVQKYGNFGSHDQGKESRHITPEYVQTCLDSLSTLVTWYFETYHPEKAEEVPVTKDYVYVFIGYRHQEPDSSLAHEFADALKQAGHDAFIDVGIRWGLDWVREIQKALEKSDYLLVLLSPEAAVSEMVQTEVTMAKELAHQHNGIPIILPVRVRYPFTEALPYQLELSLGTIQQEIWNEPDDSPRLVRRLLETITKRTGWPEKIVTESLPAIIQPTRPQPHFDPRHIIHPGGAIDVYSSIYLKRKADKDVFYAINIPRAMVTIRGPRQTGKTSLVMRIYTAMQNRIQVAFVDFQAIPSENTRSLAVIWHTIAVRIAKQLQMKEWDIADWDEEIEYDENISRFFENFVSEQNVIPLLLCFDEVDRLFKTPIKSGFFASIRSFYNSGAIDPVWKNVRWLLVTSSEPRFFIEDLSQSPFNIGMQIELSTFNPEEVSIFAHRHALILNDKELDEIMLYVGGHPYLTHLLIYHLVHNSEPRTKLFDPYTAGGGIFRDHLHRYLIQFQQEEKLAEAMRSIIKGEGCKDVKIVGRLESAGLVRWDENQKIVPFCRLYAEFFERELE